MIFLLFFILMLTPWQVRGSHKFIRDNKITIREARILADTRSKIPLTVNDEVVKQLNRLIGKPAARKHMRECLKRMEKHKPLITKKIEKYELPTELLAIPIIESGYKNIHSKNKWGSGLWMFIKPTARAYGLKVNKKLDQRLNVKLSTEAAMKYLKENHQRFDDWELTLLSYNMGEYGVMKAMKKARSKQAWTLVKKGYENDKGYLAKVIAAIIVIKNPEVLK